MYLEDRLVPGTRGPSRPQSFALFRICTGASTATCFMARYSEQHNLPISLLAEKGLMGCLLDDGDVIRFFSSAEISCLHAAHEAVWMSACTPMSMQVIGNSISVPHALAGLAYALRRWTCIKVWGWRTVLNSLAEPHAFAKRLLLAADGWVLCKHEHIMQRLLRHLPTWRLILRLLWTRPLLFAASAQLAVIPACTLTHPANPQQSWLTLEPRSRAPTKPPCDRGCPCDISQSIVRVGGSTHGGRWPQIGPHSG